MLKYKIKEITQKAIETAYPKAEDIKFVVESADPKFGDYSTNVAMIIGKAIGEKPLDIANRIAKQLNNKELFETVEVAKPGFINFKIALPYLQNQILEII